MPINLSGSLELTGSLVISGSITTTGPITISGSIASSSFAATASSADNLLVRNTLTAQTLVVQTITSSVDFVTGSTQFGSLLSNTHVFSGSVSMNPGGLFISGSGLVGIGTTSPEGKLTIQGTSAQPLTSGTTANSLLQLVGSLNNQLNIGSNTVTGDYGSYIQSSDNNLAVPYPLNLQPNGGNVGIGTSTPGYMLDVNGTGRFKIDGLSKFGFDILNNAGTRGAGFYNTGGNNVQLYFYNSASVERIVIDGGTGTAEFASTVTTTGIKFPATQVASANANTLDDYEEGTYTPDIRLGSWTFNARSGFYTKIGNLVTVNILIGWSANNAPSGDDPFQITMPFSAFGSGNFRAPATIGYAAGINFDTSRQLVSHIDMSDNYVSFRQLISGGTPSTLTTANISNSGEIQISVTYQV